MTTGDANRAYWDSIAVAALDRPVDALWREYSDLATAALLSRWLPNGARRLLKTDLFDEASTGGFIPERGPRTPQVIGIDLSLAVVAAARSRRCGLVGVASDVRALPFRDCQFDAILSTSTLDHFAHAGLIRRSLEELYRILVPGGILILTLDNPLHPLVALRNRTAEFWRRIGIVSYPVGATLGPRALRSEFAALGFDVVAVEALQHFPRIALVALERLFGRAGRRLRSKILRAALTWERLDLLPTRYLTGQFVAALARRSEHPPGGDSSSALVPASPGLRAPSRVRQKS